MLTGMNANNRTIVGLQTALDRARDDVREAGQRNPTLPEAEMVTLRSAALAAWVELETAKTGS
jgi:hypothetical protein